MDEVEGKLNYPILGPRRSAKSLAIESLNIVELHNPVIILTPPPLSLPFVEHLSASNYKCSK